MSKKNEGGVGNTALTWDHLKQNAEELNKSVVASQRTLSLFKESEKAVQVIVSDKDLTEKYNSLANRAKHISVDLIENWNIVSKKKGVISETDVDEADRLRVSYGKIGEVMMGSFSDDLADLAEQVHSNMSDKLGQEGNEKDD